MGNSLSANTNAVSGKPIEFHQVHAANVELSSNCRYARRIDGQRGLCFSNRPVSLEERVFIKVMATSKGHHSKGVGMRFGYTAVDPASDNRTLLQGQVRCSEIHTSEHGYWVKAVNEAYTRRSSVLGFCICISGEVAYGSASDLLGILFSGVRTDIPLWVVVDLSGSVSAIEFVGELKYFRNGRAAGTLMHVDCMLPLWAFFDVHGTAQTIEIIGIVRSSVSGRRSVSVTSSLIAQDPSTIIDMTNCDLNCQPSSVISHNDEAIHLRDVINHLSLRCDNDSVTSDLVPVANLLDAATPSDSVHTMAKSHSQMSITKSNSVTHFTDLLDGIPVTLPSPLIPIPESLEKTLTCEELPTDLHRKGETLLADGSMIRHRTAGECAICMESEPDCALYACGHMCMCYSCAMNVQKQRSALCPICRQPIVDILRIYRT